MVSDLRKTILMNKLTDRLRINSIRNGLKIFYLNMGETYLSVRLLLVETGVSSVR